MTAVAPPRARRDLEITEPAGDGGRYVVRDPDSGRLVRLGDGAVAVLRALDGERTLTEVAELFGGGVAPEQLEQTVATFADLGLLAGDGDAVAPTPAGFVNELGAARSRVRRNGPFSIQLELVDPSRLFERAGPVARALTGPAFWIAAALALVAAAVLGTVRAGTVAHILSVPLAPAPAVAAILALLVTIAAHEVAHAAIAWRQGARARRLGVMLLYLMPAMFCDVSDCWRLPRRRDRVKVAGAGMALQVILIAAALALSFVPGLPGGVATALLLYAAASALLVAFNLLPFVRLDGYLALMSALDTPNLRAKAMRDARAAAEHAILGRPARAPLLPRRGPALAFGVACTVTPVVLVAYGLSRVHALLLGFGAIGGLVWLAAVAAVTLLLARRAVRAVRALHADGPAVVPRAALALAVLVATLLAVGLSVSRPSTVAASFTIDGAHARLLVDPALAGGLRPGERVLLREPGLLGSTTVGTATIAAGPRTRLRQFTAPAAIRGFGATGEAVAVPLHLDGRSGPTAGTAVVAVGHRSLLGALTQTYLNDAWRLL